MQEEPFGHQQSTIGICTHIWGIEEARRLSEGVKLRREAVNVTIHQNVGIVVQRAPWKNKGILQLTGREQKHLSKLKNYWRVLALFCG